jgi:hypothetical protein
MTGETKTNDMALRRGKSVTMALAGLLAIAASGPRALAPASGGTWSVSRDAKGSAAQSLCLANPVLLGQWEHRAAKCERSILSDDGNKAVIDYRCADGGFGRSEITVLTPRTLRVATQGIAAGAPLNYVLHARRTGNCPAR